MNCLTIWQKKLWLPKCQIWQDLWCPKCLAKKISVVQNVRSCPQKSLTSKMSDVAKRSLSKMSDLAKRSLTSKMSDLVQRSLTSKMSDLAKRSLTSKMWVLAKTISDVQNVRSCPPKSLTSKMSDLWCPKCPIWQKDLWHPKCQIWHKDLWHPKCQIQPIWGLCSVFAYLRAPLYVFAYLGARLYMFAYLRARLYMFACLRAPLWSALPCWRSGQTRFTAAPPPCPPWTLPPPSLRAPLCMFAYLRAPLYMFAWGLHSICLPIWGLHSMHLSIWRLSSIHLPIWQLRSMHLPICLCPASINPRGTDCPYAVKMLACLVLLEITTFLRETFQYLPRTRSQKREHGWDKPVTTRRFSSIVSSPGHSDKSSESNIGELPSGMSEYWLFFSFFWCVCVFMWEREGGVFVCERECAYMCVCVRVCVHMCLCVCEREVCMHVSVCAYICVRVCGACVCMCVVCVCACMCTVVAGSLVGQLHCLWGLSSECSTSPHCLSCCQLCMSYYELRLLDCFSDVTQQKHLKNTDILAVTLKTVLAISCNTFSLIGLCVQPIMPVCLCVLIISSTIVSLIVLMQMTGLCVVSHACLCVCLCDRWSWQPSGPQDQLCRADRAVRLVSQQHHLPVHHGPFRPHHWWKEGCAK